MSCLSEGPVTCRSRQSLHGRCDHPGSPRSELSMSLGRGMRGLAATLLGTCCSCAGLGSPDQPQVSLVGEAVHVSGQCNPPHPTGQSTHLGITLSTLDWVRLTEVSDEAWNLKELLVIVRQR